jgi:integrase
MAKHIGRLTALFVKKHKTPGMFGDGGNLYLQITNANARSWIFRYGNRYAGLGSALNVTLEEARDAAYEYRKLLQQGIDPLDTRRARKAQTRLEAAKAVTFAKCAEGYFQAHSPGWKAKYAALWSSSMAQHILPTLGSLPVTAIDTAAILRTLTPIWTTKPETATKLRSRIEAVLDQARVLGHRDGDNPARWRGHLDKLLAAPGKVRRVEHRPAMPHASIPAFMAQLRIRESIDARALEFCILTAARSAEVLGARRQEFNLDNATWTIPAERMKGGTEHRVPLSPAALQIMSAKSDSKLVFDVGDQSGRALYKELKRLGIDASVHGFRSTFRDWAAEQTTFPNHVIEQALAHSIGKVEAAYRRSDLFEKRRELMNAWARFCTNAGAAEVVPLKAVKRS